MLLNEIVHHQPSGKKGFEEIDYESMKKDPKSKKDKEFKAVDLGKYKKKRQFKAIDFDAIRKAAPVSTQ